MCVSERERAGELVCVQEGQPLHSLQAFAVFPNWPPLFFCTESAFLISPSHPPLPVAADFLAGRQALEPGGSAGPQVRGGKAGGAEMLALHLAGVEALFLNMPSEVRSLGHFFFSVLLVHLLHGRSCGALRCFRVCH